MPEPDRPALIEIDDAAAGQRIDNFLFRICKGVPKSHIYRILRSGEVRVNKGRVAATYRLVEGDIVRIPPLRTAQGAQVADADASVERGPSASAEAYWAGRLPPVVFEDEHLLVIDKPAGLAVHGGSGISHGVIEQFRMARPQARFLELVHRLDRETSGLLLLAKKRSALLSLHEQFRQNVTDKRYLACIVGDWPEAKRVVKAALHKYVDANGERRVRVQDDGQPAHTIFTLQERFAGYALVEAQLKTGRTHQIRVHLAHLERPIAGDPKYGDFALNKALARANAPASLKRMFLHAARLRIEHPASGAPLQLDAPLPPDCQQFLQQLRALSTHAPAAI